jgi:hypothetical protein
MSKAVVFAFIGQALAAAVGVVFVAPVIAGFMRK